MNDPGIMVHTNNVPRLIIDGYELTTEERADFDYYSCSELDEATFFRYRGQLYDIGEFVMTEIEGWDGIHTDTFFSGTLVKYVDEDNVIVGRIYS